MVDNKLNLRIGIVLLLFSVFLLLYGIPQWVQSPQSVDNIFTSPKFWPQVIAGLGCITGIILIIANFRNNEHTVEAEVVDKKYGIIRMIVIFLIMVGIYLGVSTLGMVWTAMLGFLGTSLLLKNKNYIIGIIVAVLLPLGCYFFFSHILGTNIPQGLLLSLP